NDTHLERLPVRLCPPVDDNAAGFAFGEFDFLARDGVDLPSRWVVERLYFQANDGSAFTTNHLDDVIQVHIDDVDNFAIGAISYTKDLILLLQAAVLIGGPPRDDLMNRRIAVLAAKRSSNAIEFEPHHDLKILESAWRHV